MQPSKAWIDSTGDTQIVKERKLEPGHRLVAGVIAEARG